MRFSLPLAALAGLLAGALLPGCSGCSPSPGEGGGTGEPGAAPKVSRVDPAVVAARAKRPDLTRNRVLILGMDGIDPTLVRKLAGEGRLPHFQRLIDEGAFGPLRSQQPMLSPLLWTTVATGKYLTEHGILDLLIRDPNDPTKRIPVTSDLRKVEAIWDIVGRYDEKVGIVGWLASHPAEKVNGFAVSEMNEPLAYLYHQKIPAAPDGKSWPPDLVEEYQPLRRRPDDIPWSEIRPFLDVTEEQYAAACTGDEFTDENRTNNLRILYSAADNFRRVGQRLYRDRKPDLFCSYFEAIDATCHFFMAYREPVTWIPRDADVIKRMLPGSDPVLVDRITARIRGEDDGGLIPVQDAQKGMVANITELARGADPEKRRMWGGAVDAMYEYHDRILGEYMEAMDGDSILMVVSDHGFEWGETKPPFDSSFRSTLGGASYHNTHGLLALYGKGVRKGFRIPPPNETHDTGARLLDITPTALALMGFPMAEDMPGRILTEMFDLDLAVGTIPSYESDRATRLARARIEADRKRREAGGGADPLEQEELSEAMRQIMAVGYVGTEEDAPVRQFMHMAASYVEQGLLEEAEEAFTEALGPAAGRQRLNILVALGNLRLKMDDPGGAKGRFESALADNPNFVPALVGLQEVLDVEGDLPGVVAIWERIVAIPPSLPLYRIRLADALRRLGSLESARAKGHTPGSVARLERALALIEEAARPPEGATDGEPGDAANGSGGEPGPDGEKPADGHVREGWYNARGMVLVDLGRFDEAEADFRTAAEMKPDYLRPRNNLGVLFMRRAWGFLEAARREEDREKQAPLVKEMARCRGEALRWFGTVLEIDPKNAKARYNRAEVHVKFPPPDLEAARKDLELAVEAAPEYKRALALLENVRAALAAEQPPR